jgi:aminoglycoside phosphotransferase family enzyme
MLDRMIASGAARPADVRPVAELLGRFYRTAPGEPLAGAEWRARLLARIEGSVRGLARFAKHLPVALVEDVGERQVAYLERHGGGIDARVAQRRIVEGHGDLRPEHVCLEARPRIIDCLDFSRELRLVDPAEELGFLALECERLGAPAMRAEIFDAYAAVTGDRPQAGLVDFYQAVHACVRALLAVRHLDDPMPRRPAHWAPLARDYLRLAAERLR